MRTRDAANGRLARVRLVGAMAIGMALLVMVVGSVPASAATVRHASPTGSGTACTNVNPCALRTALEDAPVGAVVDVRGDQGAYSLDADLDAAPRISVRGSHGRPRIVLDDASMNFDRSTVRGLFVDAESEGTAFRLNDGGLADRVIVHQGGSGHACFLDHRARMRNSICRSYGASDKAVETDGTVTLRNVTAVGGWESGLKAYGRGNCACTTAKVTLVNTIVQAGPGGKDLWIESEDDVTIVVTATTSNFRTTSLVGPAAKRKLIGSRTNQTSLKTRPRFIDLANGNLRAAPGSPVIDKGVTSKRKNGPRDVDGRPRKAGKRTDIGASESTPPQTTITSGPSGSIADPSPAFTFSSSRAGSTFQCRLDGAAWGPCSSPSTITPGAGAHTYRIRAVDPLGYLDPTPAKRTFTMAN